MSSVCPFILPSSSLSKSKERQRLIEPQCSITYFLTFLLRRTRPTDKLLLYKSYFPHKFIKSHKIYNMNPPQGPSGPLIINPNNNNPNSSGVTCICKSLHLRHDPELEKILSRIRVRYGSVYQNGQIYYQCDVVHCKNQNPTTKKSNFIRHLLTMHSTLEEPKICCDISFYTKAEAAYHASTVHSGNVYSCTECSKTCNRSKLLERHMCTHTGEKEYKCPLCKYDSANKANLIRHLDGKIHSSDSRAKELLKKLRTHKKKIKKGKKDIISEGKKMMTRSNKKEKVGVSRSPGITKSRSSSSSSSSSGVSSLSPLPSVPHEEQYPLSNKRKIKHSIQSILDLVEEPETQKTVLPQLQPKQEIQMKEEVEGVINPNPSVPLTNPNLLHPSTTHHQGGGEGLALQLQQSYLAHAQQHQHQQYQPPQYQHQQSFPPHYYYPQTHTHTSTNNYYSYYPPHPPSFVMMNGDNNGAVNRREETWFHNHPQVPLPRVHVQQVPDFLPAKKKKRIMGATVPINPNPKATSTSTSSNNQVLSPAPNEEEEVVNESLSYSYIPKKMRMSKKYSN